MPQARFADIMGPPTQPVRQGAFFIGVVLATLGAFGFAQDQRPF
jgi:hypothetical protein